MPGDEGSHPGLQVCRAWATRSLEGGRATREDLLWVVSFFGEDCIGGGMSKRGEGPLGREKGRAGDDPSIGASFLSA